MAEVPDSCPLLVSTAETIGAFFHIDAMKVSLYVTVLLALRFLATKSQRGLAAMA